MTDAAPARPAYIFILAAIVLWAAGLRLAWCETALPGMQVDEASNAWNAWCLLRAGTDEWGQPWPLFHTRAFDDYRSPLYLYLLLPFQAAGGMNVCTTRLPAALGGAVTVLLVWYLGRRMFDASVGLIAAGLVAIAPWHIQYSRWGHEGAVVPLLYASALAGLLWAGAPCVDTPRRPRAWTALAAGITAGVACYGYGSLRLVIPATIVGMILVAPRRWWGFLCSAPSRTAAIALAAGLLVTLAPLTFKHATDPRMNRRALQTLAWDADDGAVERVGRAAARYLQHLGPRFLFHEISDDPALSLPAGYGAMAWYALPMLAIGAAVTLARARASASSRMLIAMLLTFALGDVTFGEGTAPHPLRSFAGIVSLSLLAAVGAVWLLRWLQRLGDRGPRWRTALPLAAAALAVWVAASHTAHLHKFFGSFNDDAGKYWQRHVDIMQACQWLKPRFEAADAVFVTSEMTAFPHILTLVHLEHDPRRWFAEARQYEPNPPGLQAEVACSRWGKVRLMVRPQDAMDELMRMSRDGKGKRVVMILRPGQHPGAYAPVGEIRHKGVVWLYLYEFEI